ncbi:MAG: phage Gp37/Gp68 family protein [Desulfovibrio sp.]|nr:phage Gp37/Gp68 family protein [Desulfovibrio sp.]
MSAKWNPWHGCRKCSPGCLNCYVYRMDAKFGRDPAVFSLTNSYLLPLAAYRGGRNKGEFKLQPDDGYVYTCFSSDFFLEDADPHRTEAWKAICIRQDLRFFIPTKRIHCFQECAPADWGDGYANVTVACTAENQAMADKRLPIFIALPVRHPVVIVEPILGRMDISRYLPGIDGIIVGGESGDGARICNFQWILDLRRQCLEAHTPFHFKQTGARFMDEKGRCIQVARANQHRFAEQYRLNFGQHYETSIYL